MSKANFKKTPYGRKPSIALLRWREIRSLTAFRLDENKPFTKAEQAKIKRYWERLEGLRGYSDRLYKSKSKKNLKIAQKAYGLERLDLKAVPINTGGNKNAKVRVKKGQLIISNPYVEETLITINPAKMAGDNAAAYIKKLIKDFGKNTRFLIMAGDHVVGQSGGSGFTSFDKSELAQETLFLLARYETTDTTEDGEIIRANNNWRNWFFGYKAQTVIGVGQIVKTFEQYDRGYDAATTAKYKSRKKRGKHGKKNSRRR